MPINAKIISAFLLSFVFLAPVSAQASWPNRPITLIVPYPAGGATDVVGRMVAKGLGHVQLFRGATEVQCFAKHKKLLKLLKFHVFLYENELI